MAGDRHTPRIVAGVHGTAASDAALDWAMREARLRRARLHLVLARDSTACAWAPYAPPDAPGAGRADAAWLAGAAARASRVLPPGRVTTELADGLPARILADRAEGASLLVLGAERSGFLGPVARACLRQAPCPVVIVACPAAAEPASEGPERGSADLPVPVGASGRLAGAAPPRTGTLVPAEVSRRPLMIRQPAGRC
jgi:nucleotide-binding universal stress UspA family protein